MKAAIFSGPGSVDIHTRPDPKIQKPTDVVLKVLLGCVCGSDLWLYRGETPRKAGPIGHEFIGVVEEVGAEVRNFKKGDLTIAPFMFSDGACIYCQDGLYANCANGGVFGDVETDGGQGEAVRIPFADVTLVKVPGSNHSDETLASLLCLSDVLGTGHHAAVCAGVKQGMTVGVIGDGAVGLCGIMAAKRLGADRIIALSRNPSRQALAKKFGATDIIAERGNEATAKIQELTKGIGVDATLECVGTGDSMSTAFSIARIGSTVGAVGIPHNVQVPMEIVLFKSVGLRGGIAPVRKYVTELMDDVLNGNLNPGLVFDFQGTLEQIKQAYEAMDQRKAIKSLLKVSTQ